MAGSTKEIVKFATDTDFDNLPLAVIHEAKRVLLDSIGCAFGGKNVDKGKYSIQFAMGLGGTLESTILGVGNKVSSAAAAFANGELINALDMDSMLGTEHIAPYVISAPLALGESRGASGKDLITAIVLAHEIASRIGRSTREGIFDKEGKFKLPEVQGYSSAVLGGALGTGKLLKLDEEQLLHALGLAGHMTSVPAESKWKMTSPSPMDKYAPAGWISLAEVTAVLLAEMGYTGDTTVLDGDYGFWKFFGAKHWKQEELLKNMGEEWQSLNVSYKPYPCCRMIHGALDCFIEIIEENNLMPEDIENVTALINPLFNTPVFRETRQVKTHIDAQFNLPYVFAVAVHRLPVSEWQTRDAMRSVKIMEFMKKVKFDSHPDFGKTLMQNPKNKLSSIEVAAKKQIFKKEKTWVKGDPFPEKAKMKDEELVNKFRLNASVILSRDSLDRVVEAVFELEKMDNVSELITILS